MCSPVIAAVAIGVGTAAADYSAKKAAWRHQVGQVQRQNIMAIQRGDHEGKKAIYNDAKNNQVYSAQLKAQANARTNLYKQFKINQLEASRASEAAQLQKREEYIKAAFEGQTRLSESIKAQGAVLASGIPAGKSLLLQLNDIERQMGFEEAAVNASLVSAERSYGLTEHGIRLSQHSADSRALNAEPAGPQFSPGASWGAVSPIMLQNPPKPSLLGSLMTGASSGVSAFRNIKGG
tara:strand:- start:980 stop:1687 length:708 start_codon:yes stop_codon:yes gene_type:complete